MTTRLNYVGGKEPAVKIRPVGDHEPVEWVVERDKMGNPSPREFELLNTATVKLAVAGSEIDDEDLAERVTDCLHEVQDVLWQLAELRGLDEEDARDIVMGNIHALPEATLAGEWEGDG